MFPPHSFFLFLRKLTVLFFVSITNTYIGAVYARTEDKPPSKKNRYYYDNKVKPGRFPLRILNEYEKDQTVDGVTMYRAVYNITFIT